MDIRERVIVALDVSTQKEAQLLVEELSVLVQCFKIGPELFFNGSLQETINAIKTASCDFFLDAKLHDTPNTLSRATSEIARIGALYLTVHASAGIPAMKAVVQAKEKIKVLAVTLLTSLDDTTSRAIYGAPIKSKIIQLALDAEEAGVDGLICSPCDLSLLNAQPRLKRLPKITPGIRLETSGKDDQIRVGTPFDAIRSGASQLVIGRPITRPDHGKTSIETLRAIHDEIIRALDDAVKPIRRSFPKRSFHGLAT